MGSRKTRLMSSCARLWDSSARQRGTSSRLRGANVRRWNSSMLGSIIISIIVTISCTSRIVGKVDIIKRIWSSSIG